MGYGTAVALLAASLATSCTQDTGRRQTASMDGASASPERSAPLPQFSDFSVSDTGAITPALINFDNDTLARRFRTVLREGARRGPNFAGHFTIVTWGCGSSCQMTAVVDARTGHVFQPWIQTMIRADYRQNSMLFIADPPDSARAAFGELARSEDCAVCGTPAAYAWRGDHFEPVGRGEHPHILHY